jgi:L-threonylcarbamoyladenylate synthase
VNEAVEAIRAGEAAIIPTDTVYGLVASAYTAAPTERLYALKGRDSQQPSALLAADLDTLLELVPELRGRAGVIARALLPGPYTLLLPNPARRFRWLTGTTPHTIGVRVPQLPDVARDIVSSVGAIVATSANLPGGPDPRRLEDVPAELRDHAAAVVDAGELPGVPSTVIDFCGGEPRVVREGAVAGADAIARVADVLG